MDRLRIAVLGLGNMGQVHASNIARLPNAVLHAVASRRPQVAREVAERFHVERVYTDCEEVFRDPDLDAVVIAGGIVDHVEHIVQAAQNGLHIFTEKPIAFTLEEIDRALAAVQEAGVYLQVGFMRRFDPGYALARKKIEEGAIGRPVLFKACSRDPFWPEKQDGPGYNTTYLDLGVHDFDLARWLMGSEVSQVFALGKVLVYPRLAEFGDVDNAVVSLVFESGALGSIDFSRNARYGYDIRTEVLGDEGALFIGGLQQTPLLLLSRDGVTHDVFPWYPERFADAFLGEVAAFVDALQAGRAPQPGGIDGRRASEIGVAALESWRSGKPVDVVRKT
ncbi:MAG: scyllo-inositol 2-dehydrogenase [Anaerolineae bacterium]